MEAVLHLPENDEQIKQINKELAYVYADAAKDVIAKLKLNPMQLDCLYNELSEEVKKIA